jgi:uncharacterized protein (TIGR04222 family)
MRPLHHHPGGVGDREHLAEAYLRTRDSYRRWFGEPDEDIWPAAEALPAGRPQPRRIDLRRHLPVRRSWLRAAALVAIVASVISFWRPITGGIHAAVALSVTGFVAAFIAIAIANVVLALLLWRRACSLPADTGETPALDVYESAALAAGPKGPVHVAVTELATVGALVAVSGDAGLRLGTQAPASDTPFQRDVLDGVRRNPEGRLARQLPLTGEAHSRVEARLCGLGLLVRARWRRVARAIPLGGTLALLLWAATRAYVAKTSDQPLAVCLGLPVLAVMIQVFLSELPLWRTMAGDRLLAELRADLPITTPASVSEQSRRVALLGGGALRGGPLDTIANLLEPPPSTTVYSGSSCGGCGG